MRRAPTRSLSFFKVFLEETSSEKMKIPSAYTLHMLGTLPQRTSLRDKYNNHWPVKMENIENQLYFTDGWIKFVEDNSIETGDFLFFQYNNEKVFDVKQIGRNGCDKEGVGALTFKEKEEEYMEVETIEEDEEKGNNEKSKEQESQPFKEQDAEEKQEDSNYEKIEEKENQLCNKRVKRKFAKIRKQVQSLTGKVDKSKPKDANGGLRKSNRVKNLVQKKVGAKHKRTKAIDPYGVDIFKSGILPQPKNPYFVTRIKPKRQDELYIPIIVLRDYSIKKLPEKATIRDSYGRTWSTSLSHWHDGREFYIGGLTSFCRLNFVEDNDLCICEFVNGMNLKDLIIHIQVVPKHNNPISSQRDQQVEA